MEKDKLVDIDEVTVEEELALELEIEDIEEENFSKDDNQAIFEEIEEVKKESDNLEVDIEKIKEELEIDRKKLNRRKMEFEDDKKAFEIEKEKFEDELKLFEDEKAEVEKKATRNENMFNMRKTALERKEKSFNEEEQKQKEISEKLSLERDNMTEKVLEMRKSCEEEFLNTIESLKMRNVELAKEVNTLGEFKINYEILEERLNGKDETIERLTKEFREATKKIKTFEMDRDLDELLTLDALNEKLLIVEKENKELKIEIENYKECKNQILEYEREITSLKDTADIYKTRLERKTSYIEHLKRSEKSKGVGEDTTEAIFEEIIEKENNDKTVNSIIRYSGDEVFVRGFVDYAKEAGFVYTKDLVRAFISSIKSSKLTILKGYSGTGKSSLPELIGKYLMAECVTIPVQPNWRTKQDILGFYNYFTNKFIPTELTKTIIKANVNKDKIFIVVLDEMNLARVEYYFSEFNSKIWMESEKREVELFEGVSNYGEVVGKIITDNKIKIPDNMIFIGTINEDDSVSPISDKIFDRAQVVEFKELPSNSTVGDLNNARTSESKKITRYETFISNRDYKEFNINKSKAIVNKVNGLIKEYFDKVIGYRSIGQINEFINIYINSGGEEWRGLDWQLLSKFSPKIKYIYEKNDIESLELLEMEVKECFVEAFKLKDSQVEELLFIKEIEKIKKGVQ